MLGIYVEFLGCTPWKMNGWKTIMEVWKMIFLFSWVVFRWTMLDPPLSRWRFHFFLNAHPVFLGSDPIWRAFFSDGWFNHQLVLFKLRILRILPRCFKCPIHPNAWKEGVLGMFFGSEYLLRRCLDVKGGFKNLEFDHIGGQSPRYVSLATLASLCGKA